MKTTIIIIVTVFICLSCVTFHGTLNKQTDTFYWKSRNFDVDTIYYEGDTIHITLIQ
jgi:hypothetical protein